METLLLTIVIILQIVLIFLILQREYRLLPEGLVVRYQSQSLPEKIERDRGGSENLWDNPPPASEELKLTVAEFKSKYDRSESWDGDFVLEKVFPISRERVLTVEMRKGIAKMEFLTSELI